MARVWAPGAERVELVLDGDRRPMVAAAGGWWASPPLPPGTRYAFAIDGGEPLPDPRARRQPDGVHAASEVYDDGAHPWTDGAWRGFHLPGAVLYELHVGTFSEAGTFDGAIRHLDHLADLGVDAVEVMPVAAFDGDRGWGYDGVDLWAVHEPYGGPDAFKRFVDAAHHRGLGVLLDVVYNHLGPSGAYLSSFGPYFSDQHHTPWGAGVNLDGPDSVEVRRFIIDSALMWLESHHLDGLRLDAVHALADDSATHVLAELADEVAALSAHLGRPLWITAENDTNDPRLVTAREAGGLGLDGVWADDLHHAIHVALTGEQQGYYQGYGSMADLAKALTDVYVYDGRWSPASRAVRGAPVGSLPRHRFVVCDQNHDQVGNRARGDRLAQLAGVAGAKVAAALTLLGPGTPLLFMGEEWGASTPFPYFVGERGAELDEAVRQGRRREFAEFGWAPEDVPDPVAAETFESAQLRWDELGDGAHAELLEWYRALLALRRREAALTDGRAGRTTATFDERERWVVLSRGTLDIAVNLSGELRAIPLPCEGPCEVVLSSAGAAIEVLGAVELAPTSVAVLRRLEATTAG